MSKFLLPTLCLAALLFSLGGCTHGKKSAAHMYGPDNAPTIKYSKQQENPGGYIQTY